MRILSRDLKSHIGERVLIQGWLHKQRLLGVLTFINVRDRGGLTQVVIKDKDEVEKLRGLQTGTVLEIEGTAIDEPRAPGGTRPDIQGSHPTRNHHPRGPRQDRFQRGRGRGR